MDKREIKFRAWDEKRQLMIGSDYPDNWADEKDEWWADNDAICLTAIESAVKNPNLEVMQYTGLKDKNGKEIYESDYVKWSGKIYEIKWYEKIAGFIMENNGIERLDIEFNSEVIGNIYENPNLTKEDK